MHTRPNLTYSLLLPVALFATLACTPEPPPSPQHPTPSQNTPQHDLTKPTPTQGPTLGQRALLTPQDPSPLNAPIQRLQNALKAQPNRHDIWIKLGRAWIQKARTDQTESLYANADDAALKALSLRPNTPEALHLRALVLRTEHDFKTIRTIASTLTQNNPKDELAWGLLGDAHLELGDYKRAETSYQKMIDLRPSLPSLSRAAWLRWLHNDTDGSLELWNEALRIANPNSPEPFAWCLTEAAHVEWARSRFDNALNLYNRALASLPNYAPALFGRARIHAAHNRPQEAITDLRASLKARRSEPARLWLLALLRQTGDNKAADALQNTFTSSSLETFDDPRTISLLLSSLNLRPKLALELARNDAKDRNDIFTHDALAFALLRNNQPQKALQHIQHALSLNTPDPALLTRAGLIAHAAGHPDQARTLLQRAQSLNPHTTPLLHDEVQRTLNALKTP